jgi:hypothetical protein
MNNTFAQAKNALKVGWKVLIKKPGFLPTGFLFLWLKPTSNRQGHLRNRVFAKNPVSAGAKSSKALRKGHATSLKKWRGYSQKLPGF